MRCLLKSGPYLPPCTKMNSKWIKDLSMNHETLTLLEENLRYRCRKDFLNMALFAQELTPTTDKWRSLRVLLL